MLQKQFSTGLFLQDISKNVNERGGGLAPWATQPLNWIHTELERYLTSYARLSKSSLARYSVIVPSLNIGQSGSVFLSYKQLLR